MQDIHLIIAVVGILACFLGVLSGEYDDTTIILIFVSSIGNAIRAFDVAPIENKFFRVLAWLIGASVIVAFAWVSFSA